MVRYGWGSSAFLTREISKLILLLDVFLLDPVAPSFKHLDPGWMQVGIPGKVSGSP